jgi:hypothetical protein
MEKRYGKEKSKKEKNEPEPEDNGRHRYIYHLVDGGWFSCICANALRIDIYRVGFPR